MSGYKVYAVELDGVALPWGERVHSTYDEAFDELVAYFEHVTPEEDAARCFVLEVRECQSS